MAGLDPRFILMSDLQSLFRDVSSGLPMSAGKVYAWRDISRTEPKPLYMISGTPPNYVYTALPNPITLTGIGTFSDGFGNDIIPYYYPYTGTPDDNTGVLDLYYITVVNSQSAIQFNREGLPNITAGDVETDTFENFIPNGQFLLHSNLPANPLSSPPILAGQVTQPVTNIALGGWTYERPVGSSAIDFINFTSFSNYTPNPPGSPKYAVQVICQSAGTDTFKDLRIKFTDVNKFASGTQNYVFAFWANSNSSGSVTAQIWLIKNFGSGGGTQPPVNLGSVTIANTGYPTNPYQTAPFTFGINTGLSIGPNDNVQLAVRFPGSTTYNVSLCDFILTPAPVTITSFPVTTDAKFIYQSLNSGANPPDYNEQDLYLPQVLTPTGLQFDHSQIGNIIADTTDTLKVGTLFCDGTQYQTSGYSSDGIPYSRLQQAWWNSSLNIPKFGTGPSYMTASPGSATNLINVHANTAGLLTAAADVNTGFTISSVTAGINGGIGMTGYWIQIINQENYFILQNNVGGAVTSPPDVTHVTGASIQNLRVGTASSSGTIIGQNGNQQIDLIQFSGVPSPSFYITFYALTTQYYIWYKVNGAGTDPAPGGTGILVNLNGSETAADVCQKTANAINGWMVTQISCTAGSSITAGHYFTIASSGGNYYVWYTVNGAGSDPAPGGLIGIKVAILSTDTADQVATKTIAAINSMYFQIPNLQGWMLRGHDPNQILDSGPRYSLVDGVFGSSGTFEYDDILSHFHTTGFVGFKNALGPVGPSISVISESPIFTDYTGNAETRVRNFSVKWVVKY